jgi:ATP-binding cassette subfamily C protein
MVILSNKWWCKDNGPLLAFTKEGDKPVALIPSSVRSYSLYEPETNDIQPVTDQIVQSLKPEAYTFYRPFPNKALTFKDLVIMGLRGCSRDVFMVLIMGVAGALLGLLTPIATGYIFDSVIPGAANSQLFQVVAILIACAMAIAAFKITKDIAVVRIEGKMGYTLHAAVWDRLLSLPVPFFRKYTAGDLASRSMGIMRIRAILSGVVVSTMIGGIFSTFYLALLFYYDFSLALVAVVLSIAAVIFFVIVGYLQACQQRKIMKIEGKNTGVILQLITGIAKLRVSGTEDRAFALWAKNFAAKKTFAFKAGFIRNIQETFNSCFPVLASLAIFAWLIMQRSGMTTGQFLAFNYAYFSFQNAMLQMTLALTASLQILPLYERTKPILQALPEADETKTIPGKLSGEIEVSHTFFRYTPDGPLVLKDVSLRAYPGEFVAIVGGSGCGKSTLLRLLLGFETPEMGNVYYDGQDLNSLDIREVRRQIGVVLQYGKPMQGDIFKNIVGTTNLTIDDAWEAARLVGFEPDIKDMPMGMHTKVPAGGGTLSGGQRQRMMIARAIVRRPRILYLDEATSALDNQSQRTVARSLESLHVTRIVIAHRLSTIINADRIYVLDKGEIIQVGTYDELMRKEGFFAEMAKRQIA